MEKNMERLDFIVERYGWTYDDETERRLWGLVNTITQSEVLSLEKAKYIRECLKNIYLDIEPLISINGRYGLPWSVKIKPEEADLQKLYLGEKAMIKLPVAQLREMLSLRLPGVASIEIPQYIRGKCFDFAWYKDLVNKLESIINDYDSYFASVSKEADMRAKAKLYREKLSTIEKIVDNAYAEMDNIRSIPDIKFRFTNNTSDQINYEDFYYDMNQNTLHASYNTDLIRKGSNKYRKLVKGALNDVFLKIPAFILKDDASVIDARYWTSRDTISTLSKRTPQGMAIKRMREYTRKSELTMITYPDGKPFVNEDRFILYAVGFIPYKLDTFISYLIKTISAFDKEEKVIYHAPRGLSDINYAPYGKFSSRTRRAKPAYEDVDIYDREEYVNIDEIIDSYYSLREAFDEGEEYE